MLQFQSSGSVDQVNAVFNSSIEFYQHETELRYNLLRYLVWLIPTLGFVGTVIGIALALETAGGMFADIDPNANMAEMGPQMMTTLTGELRRGVLHDAARAAAVGGADVRAARGPGM